MDSLETAKERLFPIRTAQIELDNLVAFTKLLGWALTSMRSLNQGLLMCRWDTSGRPVRTAISRTTVCA